MSDIRDSVGWDANSAPPQIRCGAVPSPNFTTRPSSDEPWTTQACCAKYTVCSEGNASSGQNVMRPIERRKQ